jgi:hypothetical protein
MITTIEFKHSASLSPQSMASGMRAYGTVMLSLMTRSGYTEAEFLALVLALANGSAQIETTNPFSGAIKVHLP